MSDPLNAFIPHDQVLLPGAPEGPLRGLRFAAKDIYDIAGHVTGCGNPDWLATHPPAAATASAVDRLLAAGADPADVRTPGAARFRARAEGRGRAPGRPHLSESSSPREARASGASAARPAR